MGKAVERPAGPLAQQPQFGSDLVADTLRALDVPFVAFNPGASFRGLHDSLVNYLGNSNPQMLLCLHEEHAVAIAHGYAKVTGRPMAAALHANVGLMHGSMAIFNAWCDRMPVLLIGATGPVDAAARRPWIDWIHTARDQGALIRDFTKWDDQPASPEAAREAVARAWWIARTPPCGPTYVNLDSSVQEAPLDRPPPPVDPKRQNPDVRSGIADSDIRHLADMLGRAERPLFLIGRVSRDRADWDARVALAERVGARVLTDSKVGAAFPTDHPLHVAPPAHAPGPEERKLLERADLILSLDWVDLAGTLPKPVQATVVQVSQDFRLHRGWSMDYQAHPDVDLFLAAEPGAVVPGLLEALPAGGVPRSWGDPNPMVGGNARLAAGTGPLRAEVLAITLRQALEARRPSLLHTTITWRGEWWPYREPLDYIGSDGGGGIGAGPGIAVGAALALRDTGRFPVAVCGDGDFMMGATALWTAVHYELPLLIVVANNRSYFNDEVHQDRVARARNRPRENRWIGQRITDPDLDIAGLARAQGAAGFGPVHARDELEAAYDAAIAEVDRGGVAVVDVWIEPELPPGAEQDRKPAHE